MGLYCHVMSCDAIQELSSQHDIMERVALSLVKGGLYSKVIVAMVMAYNNSPTGRGHV